MSIETKCDTGFGFSIYGTTCNKCKGKGYLDWIDKIKRWKNNYMITY